MAEMGVPSRNWAPVLFKAQLSWCTLVSLSPAVGDRMGQFSRLTCPQAFLPRGVLGSLLEASQSCSTCKREYIYLCA